MKVIEKKVKSRLKDGIKSKVNHALDKYNGVVLAPDKLALAEKSLKKLDLDAFKKLVLKSK